MPVSDLPTQRPYTNLLRQFTEQWAGLLSHVAGHYNVSIALLSERALLRVDDCCHRQLLLTSSCTVH